MALRATIEGGTPPPQGQAPGAPSCLLYYQYIFFYLLGWKKCQPRDILYVPAELAALSLRKGALPLSLYEMLSLLIALATLVATILK